MSSFVSTLWSGKWQNSLDDGFFLFLLIKTSLIFWLVLSDLFVFQSLREFYGSFYDWFWFVPIPFGTMFNFSFDHLSRLVTFLFVFVCCIRFVMWLIVFFLFWHKKILYYFVVFKQIQFLFWAFPLAGLILRAIFVGFRFKYSYCCFSSYFCFLDFFIDVFFFVFPYVILVDIGVISCCK